MRIVIYTTEFCPKCQQLKDVLKSKGIEFEEADMTTPESLTELRMNCVFTMVAPVLQIGDVFVTHDKLFKDDRLDYSELEKLLSGSI
ncbi:MAG TPA: NrdH-redoxin [Methanosarcinales archaeon]|nr:NrdH-redoxin [Methanosarcinales archaeon]